MRVFLTGASGFIGARIAECLAVTGGAQVHALIHRFGTAGAARVARLAGVRMFYGDLRDPKAIQQAAEGCAYFIHCATGTSGNRRVQEAITVEGTRHVLEAARRAKAERVVYFSSASVHGPARSSLIQEDHPFTGDFPYARMKIQAEAVVAEYATRQRVPVVVLRPTCVWGPCSPNWTVAAVELIRQERAFLPLEGRGVANAVYIDNLVDAVWLALTTREAIGEALLINDDEPLTWGELYGGYARRLGVPLHFVSAPPGVAELWRVSFHNAGVILRDAMQGRTRAGIQLLREAYTHIPLAKGLLAVVPEGIKGRLKQYVTDRELVAGAASASPPSSSDLLPCDVLPRPTWELYASQGRYANAKAKRLLGWRPRVPFQEAMARTCQWLSYAGYAP